MNTTEKRPGLLAYTLTPNPARYRSHDPVEQYEALLYTLYRLPRLRKCFEEFYFTPEVNLQGNVHIHGYYKVKNKYEYNRWFLPASKQWGFIKVKNDVDTKWTDEYCRKDLVDMIDLLYENNYGVRMPVPITLESLQKYTEKMENIGRMQVRHPQACVWPKKIKKRKVSDYFK